MVQTTYICRRIERRENFRERRRAYFARPAIKIGHSWSLEKYIPDPEDHEWFWKEGLELDLPAQSVYQLNDGKVFWDLYKHLRNKENTHITDGLVTTIQSIKRD